MTPRQLRKLFREPYWLVLAGALVVGALAGSVVARERNSDLGSALVGHAWRGNAEEAREILTALFGLQVTVVTIVLSLNAPMIKSAAKQYSPRLVPFYLKNVPLRRALPVIVLSGGYILAAARELGLVIDDNVRPRIVLSGAVALIVVAFTLLTTDMIQTFRFMRVERILGLVRDSTLAAIARLAARARRLPLDPTATMFLLSAAAPLRATASGYLVEIDILRLTRLARRTGTRARICRSVGDFVDRGEVVGWVECDAVAAPGAAAAGPPAAATTDDRVGRELAATVLIAPTREPDFDPIYGIRILAEVAARALSSSSNDSYTARQALQQMRSVLRHLAGQPLGDWNVVDADGTVRVSVRATQFREFISVAVDAPLRLGAGDPEVLDGVLEIALEVGLAAHDADGRAAAYQLVARVLDDAVKYGTLDGGRFKRLLAEVELVRSSLQKDAPRADRHAREDWALVRDDTGAEGFAPEAPS